MSWVPVQYGNILYAMPCQTTFLVLYKAKPSTILKSRPIWHSVQYIPILYRNP